MTLTSVIDFRYRDERNQVQDRGLGPFLERMFAFRVGNNNLERYSLHVHTLKKWSEREPHVWDRARRITAVNIRRCARKDETGYFQDVELYGLPVLPCSPHLRGHWRDYLDRSQDLEWDWSNRPNKLPALDGKKSHKTYQQVQKVLEYAAQAAGQLRVYHTETER